MRTSVLSLGALALGLVSANEYPNCEPDNCYREMVDPRFAEEAASFCPEFLAGTTTAATAIPTNFENCELNVSAVSSACSCITYSASTTEAPATSTEVPETSTEEPEPSTTEEPETSTTEEPETTTTEEPETTTTEAPESSTTEEPESSSSSGSSSTTKWTTSTITTTTTRTITSCPPSVTACPSGHHTVTTETIITTTVCPVTEEPTDEPTTPPPASSAFGTITVPTTQGPRPTTSQLPVPGGAGRVVGGVEGIALVAGVVAALL